MRLTCLLAFTLVACGGSAPPPEAPAPIAPIAAQPPPAPDPPPKPADAERTARAFVEAIAKHDVDAAVRASSEDFGRGQSRVYAKVSGATLDGPAPVDAWPHIADLAPDGSLFWASFGTEKILLFVAPRKSGGFEVAGLRNQADRNEVADKEKKAKELAERPKKLEAQGKLLTKPAKSSLKITIDSGGAPAVGDRAELMRRVDPSVPLFGGSWLVIADAEVTAVDGKTVTLKILAEKSDVKVNGKKVDHYTPGVPVRVSWSPGAK